MILTLYFKQKLGSKITQMMSFFSRSVAQVIIVTSLQTEKKNGGGLTVFYDGTLRVDIFSNKC